VENRFSFIVDDVFDPSLCWEKVLWLNPTISFLPSFFFLLLSSFFFLYVEDVHVRAVSCCCCCYLQGISPVPRQDLGSQGQYLH